MHEQERLEGKVAIVTGSSSGIGRAIALELARRGASIACVNFRGSPEAAGDVAQELEAMGRPTYTCAVDVSRADEVHALVEAAVERFDRIDILVNNAGIEKNAPLLDIEERDWDLVLGANLKGAFLCTQAVARQMVKQGGGGRIINISSVHEDLGFPGYLPYTCKGRDAHAHSHGRPGASCSPYHRCWRRSRRHRHADQPSDVGGSGEAGGPGAAGSPQADGSTRRGRSPGGLAPIGRRRVRHRSNVLHRRRAHAAGHGPVAGAQPGSRRGRARP